MNGMLPEPPPFLSKEEVTVLKKTILKPFSEEEQDFFIRRCIRGRLDPFSQQVHATKRRTKNKSTGEYEVKMAIVTGIGGFTAIADRTGNYDGCIVSWAGPDEEWKPQWLNEETYPAAARCEVHHKRRKLPEVAIARWSGFVQQQWNKQTNRWEIGEFWADKPDYMLAKCAKAHALRGAFPDELGGMYITEELEHLNEELDGAELDSDENKIAENREKEKKVKIPGAKVVESKGERPSPAEALEPAFPEDRIPERPKAPAFSEQLQKDFPPAPPQPPPEPPPQPQDDNIDLGGIGPADAPPPEPRWKNYVIRGITNKMFKNRTIGSLSEGERQIIEEQWLPALHEQWERATQEQKDEKPLFEEMLEFYKQAKPY